MFAEKSIVVNSWVRVIEAGLKTVEDVPNLFNLKEMVIKVLDMKGGDK